jgi:hypothetical protein
MIIRAGGPCPCKEGRYVRFVIPPNVPGCRSVISCRPTDSVRSDEIIEHSIPSGSEIHIRIPGVP